jgi:indoleamine 2,3-dioxygenase
MTLLIQGRTWHKFNGGSNAQSSLIQFFDIALGISHESSNVAVAKSPDRGTSSNEHNFIEEMRFYMPRPHHRFLQAVEKVANVRDSVLKHSKERELCTVFESCLAMTHTSHNRVPSQSEESKALRCRSY